MAQEKLELTWNDVEALMRMNPMAAEQLKSIVLRRKLADAERRLAGLTGDDQAEPTDRGDRKDSMTADHA